VGFICCVVSTDLRAQRWALSATTGMNLYKGDLSDWKLLPSLDQLKVISTAVKFNVRYQRTQAFAYRAQASIGRISGAGFGSRRRPLGELAGRRGGLAGLADVSACVWFEALRMGTHRGRGNRQRPRPTAGRPIPRRRRGFPGGDRLGPGVDRRRRRGPAPPAAAAAAGASPADAVLAALVAARKGDAEG
jgi:hypothetical protein